MQVGVVCGVWVQGGWVGGWMGGCVGGWRVRGVGREVVVGKGVVGGGRVR